MADNKLDTVALTVGGRALDPALYARLTSVRVEESVQLPDSFEIRIEDFDFQLLDSGPFSLGTPIDIALRAEGEPVHVTSGETTAIGAEPGASGRHEVVISGFDLSHRLARTPRQRSYNAMTDADIATQIAGEYGLDAEVSPTGAVRDHVLQANETDYAFLKRRAARIGFDFWITDRTCYFAPRPRAAGSAPPSLRWGENLHRFKVRFSAAGRCDTVVVRGWDPLSKLAVVGTASRDEAAAEAGVDVPGARRFSEDAAAAFGPQHGTASRFPVDDQSEADALASSLMTRAHGGEVIARGEAEGNPMICAGAQISVEGAGTRLSGHYQVTSVEHIFGSGRPYLTRFVCGGKEPDALVDLLGGGGEVSPASPSHPMAGLTIGEVTNNDDPEKLGRVRLRFPALTEDHDSTWARLLAPGGGADRGLMWVPEVGDEVLVGFELGEHSRPVVLGGLWSRRDPPPRGDAVLRSQVTTRVLTSRSGHSLTFADDEPAGIDLEHGACSSRLHLAEESSSLAAARDCAISGEDLTVCARGDLVLEGANIKIKAQGLIEINGRQIRLN